MTKIASRILNPYHPYFQRKIEYCEENSKAETRYAMITVDHCKSPFFVGLVNMMGEQGIFDILYDIITRKQNSICIREIGAFSSIIAGLSPILARDFARQYISKIYEAVWNKLFSDLSWVETVIQPKFQALFYAFKILLEKVYPRKEAMEIIYKARLRICVTCLDSKALKIEVAGLRLIDDMIKEDSECGERNIVIPSQANFQEFLERHHIISLVFENEVKNMLVISLPSLLCYLISQKLIQDSHLRALWDTLEKEHNNIIELFKALPRAQDIAAQKTLLDFLVTQIFSLCPKDIKDNHMTLLSCICGFRIRSDLLYERFKSFFKSCFWGTSDNSKLTLVDSICSKLSQEKSSNQYKMDIMLECIENIRYGIEVDKSIKVLHQLLAAHTVEKNDTIKYLNQKTGLMKILLNDIKAFKLSVKQKLQAQGLEQNEIPLKTLNSALNMERSYLTQLKSKIEFISYLIDKTPILSYELLSDLWDELVENAYTPVERILVLKLLVNLHYDNEIFTQLFRKKINAEKSLPYLRSTSSGFQCFKKFFLTSNKYPQFTYDYWDGAYMPTAPNVLPSELEGYESIWSFIFLADDERISNEAIDLLIILIRSLASNMEDKISVAKQEILVRCMEYLRQAFDSEAAVSKANFRRDCLNALKLINKLMDESEKAGTGSMISHARLQSQEVFNLKFDVNFSGYSRHYHIGPQVLKIKARSTDTVFDLHKKIAGNFKIGWDEIIIRRYCPKYTPEIPFTENGRTLSEVGIGKLGKFRANTNRGIPCLRFRDNKGLQHPRVRTVFEKWFLRYSDNGKMNPESCAALLCKCQGIYWNVKYPEVRSMFNMYDRDRDGFLTFEEFLEYYNDKDLYRVFSSLEERNDLRELHEVENEVVDLNSLIAYTLSTNEKYSALLWSLLDCEDRIAVKAWETLARMPTRLQSLRDILNLKGVKNISDPQQRDWNNILESNSKYKFLYALNIVEYLVDDSRQDLQFGKDNEDLGQFEIRCKKKWQAEFIYFGGLDQLCKIFELFTPNRWNILNLAWKRVIGFIRALSEKYSSMDIKSLCGDNGSEESINRFLKLASNYKEKHLEKEREFVQERIKKFRKKKLKRDQFKTVIMSFG